MAQTVLQVDSHLRHQPHDQRSALKDAPHEPAPEIARIWDWSFEWKSQVHLSLLQGNHPIIQNYIKRTLVLYESNLQDEQVSYMMNQISYPMHTIGLPKNSLSLLGLEHVINAANTLYHEVIDCSYNSKLISVSGSKIFSLTNANPSVKKLTLKGCYVLLGEEDEFFQGLSNNMCLQ